MYPSERDELIRSVAREAAKEAAEELARMREIEQQERRDRRFQNAKFLMEHYRELQAHAGEAIESLAELDDETYEFFEALMSDNGIKNLSVQAIVQSKTRTKIMLVHVDAMLEIYRKACVTSLNEIERRRWRVLYGLYLADTPLSVEELALREFVDARTVRRDADAACERLGVLLFGIPFFGRE